MSFNSKKFDINAFNELKVIVEEFDPSISLEEYTISSGMHTVVLEHEDKNKVILITQEKEKYTFLSKLKERERFHLKKIKKAPSNLPEAITFAVQENKTLTMFEMNRASDFTEKYIESIVGKKFSFSNVLRDFTFGDDPYYPTIFSSSQELKERKDELINDLEKRLEDNSVEIFEEFKTDIEFFQKYNDLSKQLIDSLSNSFDSVIDLNTNKSFVMDLHSEQFVLINGKLICVDPVMFNYESVF